MTGHLLTTFTVLFSLTALLSSGCGDFGAHCPKKKSIPLDWNEKSPHGITPAQIIADYEGTYERVGYLTSNEEHLINFTIELVRSDQKVSFDPNTMIYSDNSCGDSMRLPATLTIKSDDGLFDETFSVRPMVTQELWTGDANYQRTLEIIHGFSPEDINGTWTPPPAPEGMKFEELLLWFSFLDGDVWGSIDVHFSSTSLFGIGEVKTVVRIPFLQPESSDLTE